MRRMLEGMEGVAKLGNFDLLSSLLAMAETGCETQVISQETSPERLMNQGAAIPDVGGK